MPAALSEGLDSLEPRRLLLFGGKGGVGKTTISIAAAIHLAKSRPVILFTTDPASNLSDVFEDAPPIRVEALDADALYKSFLGANLDAFLEIGDRGTYLDKEELRRLFELSIPGIDELMAWMRVGQLVEENEGATIVVDTAPTGHTLRMLSSAGHFRQLASALDSMEQKHRSMIRQFTRRDVRDAMDDFIDDFESQAQRRRDLMTDAARCAFIPVMLSEPWVVEQTLRLKAEVAEIGVAVPFVILNRAIDNADCDADRERMKRDSDARARVAPVVDAPRSCVPLDTPERIAVWTAAAQPPLSAQSEREQKAVAGATAVQKKLHVAPLLFLAGKGGVGKTTCSASIALQRAAANPDQRFVIISVDPAHSLRDVFAHETPPPNLTVEAIDTRAKWRAFRDTIGRDIENAIDSLAPRGMSVAYDADAMKQLIEIAPPGADEIFAMTRLAELVREESISGVIVDTAPTGHFLRLMELPHTAGEWVREFMRLLLRYRDLIPPGSLGEELVHASRSLKELDEVLRSERTAVIVVTRPERVVVAETLRLRDSITGRGIRLGGVIANYLTPANDCACDRSLRSFEMSALEPLDGATLIQRREHPPVSLDELRTIVPL